MTECIFCFKDTALNSAPYTITCLECDTILYSIPDKAREMGCRICDRCFDKRIEIHRKDAHYAVDLV